MRVELGSQAWLDRCCEQLNSSEAFRSAARGWKCSLGLAFLDDEGTVEHRVVLEMRDGRCEDATEVDAERFDQAPVRLSASQPTWQRILDGDLNPLRAIMLRRVKLDGDLLHLVKYATAARALFDCAAGVQAPRADDATAPAPESA